ncbi:MAG TPA: c-type cytochrome [Casimicrobiaceae bacterium]|nr:c-type cytochrome [Casimicrobiaceae bacterium]
MKRPTALLAIATITAAPLALADAGTDRLQKDGCTACHSIDTKIVGPAYKDVAEKYRNDSGAQAKLIEKVKKGGSGVWGQIPMPPNSPQVSDADIKADVEYILSLKK